MKNIQLFYGVLCIALICSSSCEKEVDLSDRLDIYGEKIVVFGFISPQEDTIKINVSKSFNRADQLGLEDTLLDDLLVKDAKVTIEGNGLRKELSYNPVRKKYMLPGTEFPIKEGQMYTLEVIVDGFQKVTAETTIPSMNTTILEPKFFSGGTYQTENVFFQIGDIPDQENYYIVFATDTYETSDGPSDGTERAISFGINSDMLDNFYSEISDEIYPSPKFLTDKRSPDGIIDFYGKALFTRNEGQKMRIKTYLYTVDKLYYDFHKLLSEYNPNHPFYEPSNFRSNVTNGIGVFSGYQLFEQSNVVVVQ
ncbi:DUF4249 domain-containing protein [Aquimarina hainanensis]|uniref:DUF4249 domain-containing protein n=1 Tax=Aquimarina hainanensis TaxID=1578017 RepID=A0ABW5NDB3_9FLAO